MTGSGQNWPREVEDGELVELLLRGGRFTRVGEDEDDAWQAWVAALEVGGWHGIELDPRTLGPADAAQWRLRVRGGARPYEGLGERLWLLDADGERAGLAQVHCQWSFWGQVGLVYLHPERRREGLGTAALDAVAAASGDLGLFGALIETQWTWMQSWRAYRAMGLWLLHFKRGLVFARPVRGGAPVFREVGDRLELHSFDVHGDGHLLAWAERSPDGRELVALGLAEERERELPAGSTLTVELAFRGWPLTGPVTPEDTWSSDGGLAPGALAWRLDRWTDTARSNGWIVPDDLPDPPRVVPHEWR